MWNQIRGSTQKLVTSIIGFYKHFLYFVICYLNWMGLEKKRSEFYSLCNRYHDKQVLLETEVVSNTSVLNKILYGLLVDEGVGTDDQCSRLSVARVCRRCRVSANPLTSASESPGLRATRWESAPGAPISPHPPIPTRSRPPRTSTSVTAHVSQPLLTSSFITIPITHFFDFVWFPSSVATAILQITF